MTRLANVSATIARILLGLIFGVLGSNGILHFIPAPPIPGLAGAFLDVFFRSHYIIFVSAVQVAAGIMLLTKQFVPLALVLLGAVLANILTYHITMQPQGLPLPAIVTTLWVVAALPYRTFFAPLFARQIDSARRLGDYDGPNTAESVARYARSIDSSSRWRPSRNTQRPPTATSRTTGPAVAKR